MVRMGPGRVILIVLGAWGQIWSEWASGVSFSALWLGDMGPDMARMSVTRFILSTLAAWAQLWPEGALGDSF